jgi:hypothetical protein
MDDVSRHFPDIQIYHGGMHDLDIGHFEDDAKVNWIVWMNNQWKYKSSRCALMHAKVELCVLEGIMKCLLGMHAYVIFFRNG